MPQNTTDVSGQDSGMLNTTIGSGEEVITPAIHLTLQGKGGVGKSLVASILAQYFRHRGAEIHCLDTDPVNQTFSQYTGVWVPSTWRSCTTGELTRAVSMS